MNRPHHPDGVCRVCRLSNRRADGCGVPADRRRTPGAGRRAQHQPGRPRREMAACPAWLPLDFSPGARPARLTIAQAVVNRDGSLTATAIRRQIRRTPQASSPPGAAAMKPSWPMASPSGPRPDRLRHEAAWSLPPQGGSAGPQDLHLPQHRIKDSFLPQVILAFRARLGAENLSKMLYKCLVAASTIRSFSISGSGKSPGFAGGAFAVAKSISNRLPANCLTSCWKIPIISRCQVRPRA